MTVLAWLAIGLYLSALIGVFRASRRWIYRTPGTYWTHSDEERARIDKRATNVACWGFVIWLLVTGLCVIPLLSLFVAPGRLIALAFWALVGVYSAVASAMVRPDDDRWWRDYCDWLERHKWFKNHR